MAVEFTRSVGGPVLMCGLGAACLACGGWKEDVHAGMNLGKAVGHLY